MVRFSVKKDKDADAGRRPVESSQKNCRKERVRQVKGGNAAAYICALQHFLLIALQSLTGGRGI